MAFQQGNTCNMHLVSPLLSKCTTPIRSFMMWSKGKRETPWPQLCPVGVFIKSRCLTDSYTAQAQCFTKLGLNIELMHKWLFSDVVTQVKLILLGASGSPFPCSFLSQATKWPPPRAHSCVGMWSADCVHGISLLRQHRASSDRTGEGSQTP